VGWGWEGVRAAEGLGRLSTTTAAAALAPRHSPSPPLPHRPPPPRPCPRAPPSRTQDLYISGMREMPLLVAQMAPRARVPSTVYVPPPLQNGGWLWWPEFNKVWAHLGMPGYSF
jgi:hypothetical protein